ncbi:hypothetical protein LINGRAHAP2_LOCUS11147 [Linum grandiflorum]
MSLTSGFRVRQSGIRFL